MPTLEFSKQAPAAVRADTLVVFASKGGDGVTLGADAEAVARSAKLDLAGELAGIRYEAGLGKVAFVPTRGGAKTSMLLVTGLGAPDEVDLERLRRAAGAAARKAPKDSTLAIVVPGDALDASDREVARALAEGAGLGAYAYTEYRTKPHDSPSLEAILLLAGAGVRAGDVRDGVAEADPVVRAVALARDLVNTPPAAKRPPALAERVAGLAREAGLKVTVLDEQTLERRGFGGILGVGQGSTAPPRLVELTYAPMRSRGHVVLAGKGITFDSGGLSLKPSSGMATMKSDMAGAAAVTATLLACKAAGVRAKVTGLLALAENMPSGHAIRVSDVLTHYGGRTVEVMNTDAEGRLVLADALAYGAEQSPDAMIDLATLTGAQIVALGAKVAAVMGSDQGLVDRVRAAASTAGEQVWPLPLPAEYADQLKSEVADLKNIGKGREAGALVGGLFLKEFVGDVPWAHLDIAGPAFSDDGDSFYTPKGGTGMGVRTLLRFLVDHGS